jgi:glycosyl transferase family 25
MSSLQILVISLKHSAARRARVTEELAKTGLAWSFLDAVDGSTLDLATVPYDAAKVQRLLGFALTPKEIGCYLSHMSAWKACVQADQATLVLEDDFVISPLLGPVLQTLLEVQAEWQIVRLQALCESSCDLQTQHDGWQLVRNHSDPLGATAYLVNPRSAAQLLANSAEIFEPVDHYIEHHEKHGLTMLAVKPYPIEVVDPTRATSTITDRPDRPTVRGWRKRQRSWYRWLDRTFSAHPWFPR